MWLPMWLHTFEVTAERRENTLPTTIDLTLTKWPQTISVLSNSFFFPESELARLKWQLEYDWSPSIKSIQIVPKEIIQVNFDYRGYRASQFYHQAP